MCYFLEEISELVKKVLLKYVRIEKKIYGEIFSCRITMYIKIHQIQIHLFYSKCIIVIHLWRTVYLTFLDELYKRSTSRRKRNGCILLKRKDNGIKRRLYWNHINSIISLNTMLKHLFSREKTH